MKEIFYIIKNDSRSEGQYLLNGEYVSLFPGERIILPIEPTNVTSNLSKSFFKKESTSKVTPVIRPKKTETKKSSKKSN